MISIDDYVIDVLMRDLVGHDRRVVSFLVYLWFTGEQRKGNVVEASYRQIAESIGVSKSSAQAAVAPQAKAAGLDQENGHCHAALQSADPLARLRKPQPRPRLAKTNQGPRVDRPLFHETQLVVTAPLAPYNRLLLWRRRAR